MQVLVLAVQNAVDYDMLGAATSGVTLFRGMGGSVGAAVFGTIFSSRLASELRGAADRSARASGRRWRPPDGRAGGPPAGAGALELRARLRTRAHALCSWRPPASRCSGSRSAWLLPERTLRETAATSRGLDDGLAAPRSADSLAEIERALDAHVGPRSAAALPRAARQPRRCRAEPRRHLGARADQRARSRPGPASGRAGRGRPARIAAVVDELRQRGLIGSDGGDPALTAEGRTLADRAVTARRELLTEALDDDTAGRDPAVSDLLQRLASELCGEPPGPGDAPRLTAAAAPA